jgi:hypothetical protein
VRPWPKHYALPAPSRRRRMNAKVSTILTLNFGPLASFCTYTRGNSQRLGRKSTIRRTISALSCWAKCFCEGAKWGKPLLRLLSAGQPYELIPNCWPHPSSRACAEIAAKVDANWRSIPGSRRLALWGCDVSLCWQERCGPPFARRGFEARVLCLSVRRSRPVV